jgi:glutamyl-tRNA reductase
MVDVGLEAVADHLDTEIAEHDVLVVGAGEIGALTVTQLAEAGVAGITVWNRSADKATRLAARVGADVVPTAELAAAVAAADVVVCTTGAPEPVLDLALLEDAARRRRGGPVIVLDLAVPRNVAPEADALPEVTIVDIAEVREVAQRGQTGDVVAEARTLVAAEAEGFRRWLRQIEVEPTIRALRVHAEGVRRAELDRLASRLADLDDDQLQAVEALTEGIINTLLHEPTVRLKRLADTNPEHHVGLLADLFALDVPDPDDEPVDDR